jgi:hypothetical protein
MPLSRYPTPFNCFRETSVERAIHHGIDGIPLTQHQKEILVFRFTNVLRNYKRRSCLYAGWFHMLRFLVTVGSLIVPALLSVNFDTATCDPQVYTILYWITWTLSLLVTTSNGVITLFKVDKKYYMLHTIYEQLQSEGWQFMELSGKYSGFYTPNHTPTHENQFKYFCHAIEKIKMRQVEDEYYKVHEQSSSHPTPHAPSHSTIVPPSPINLDVLQQLLKSKKGKEDATLQTLQNIAEGEGEEEESISPVSSTRNATAPAPTPTPTAISIIRTSSDKGNDAE